jgi:hypothetical protein
MMAEDVHAMQARCRPYLARLAVLAQSQADAPLPPSTPVEVAQATAAILAETLSIGRTVVAGAAGNQQVKVAEFLAPRIARLTSAARDAVAAARMGDAGALRRELRRFNALATALWTVHRAVAIPAARLPAARTGRPGTLELFQLFVSAP